jgi:uncharacterized cupredoxin-like copper-binding protein
MGRKAWAVCIIGLSYALVAGCSTLDVAGFLALKDDGNERVVNGSLDAVAQSTQSDLSQMGFHASVTRNGETIRVASKTSMGKTFTVVLKAAKGPNGEQATKIRVEWDGEGDQQTGLQLLAQIEAAAKR